MNLEFTSSDERVVQVDRTGLLSAVGVGEAVVRVKTYNGLEAECAVTVMKAPTAMTVWPQSITACVEDAVQLVITYGGDDEFGSPLFDTSDSEIAQVDANGLVTFVKPGNASIFVESYNGLMVEVPVEVCETPTEVEFALSSAVILKGDRANLEVIFDQAPATIPWRAAIRRRFALQKTARLKPLKAGTVTITLEMPSLGLQAECTVEVVEKLDGIVVMPEDDEIEIEGQTQLTYTLLPTNAVGTGLVHFESVHTDNCDGGFRDGRRDRRLQRHRNAVRGGRRRHNRPVHGQGTGRRIPHLHRKLQRRARNGRLPAVLEEQRLEHVGGLWQRDD